MTTELSEPVNVADLSHLSECMVTAAREFVDLKFRIDTEGRKAPKNLPDDLHGPVSGGEYGPLGASCFFNNIIPFFPRDITSNKATVMSVPIAHTLGCSWHWWPDYDKPTRDKDKIISFILSEHGARNTAYTYIPELGLCLAEEGQNRVNFCRYHHIPHVLANVYTRHYPEAERINVYVLEVAGGSDVWAVLDDRYVQKVSYFGYALPLLRAYGVTISERWPESLPALNDVLLNVEFCTDKKQFHRPVIDIQAVKECLDKAERGERYVKFSLLDLPIRRKFTGLAWTLGSGVAASVMWGIFSEGVMGQVFLALLAFSGGILAVMLAPVLQIKRKHLED